MIFRLLSFLMVFMFSICQNTALAQRNFDDVEITVGQLSETIFMLQGSGGNIGLCVGDDGVFMIDDQYAPLSDKIKKAIASITDKPVTMVINTHWHGDHSGGNENFSNSGAIIVAHKNVRKRMSSEQLIQAFGRTVPASPDAALPVITFEDEIFFHLNGEDIIATHTHDAHTDGDVFIYFPKSNIVHMGDTFFQGRYPFIDVSSGGSINGIIKTANTVLSFIDDKTKIIPGHGRVSVKKDLVEYRDMLVVVRDAFKTAYDAGKTIDEIKAMNITKAYDADFGTGFIKPEKLMDILYSDFSRGGE